MPRPLRLFLLKFLVIPVTLAMGQSAVSKPSYQADAKFQAVVFEAKKLARQHEFSFAVDAYGKANKIAGGICVSCLNSIYDIEMGTGDFKKAVATASQLEGIAATPTDKSLAEEMRGAALLRGAGDKPKPGQMEAAQALFEAALKDMPENNAARWGDACVLARMGKNEDASKQFATCAEMARASDPMKVRARHFAENPALSMAKMVPAFEVTALDGQRFNLDNMGGRVVLIDFWATWCGPCNAELPHMRKIAKEFANDPLVIISISWDNDEEKWKSFVAKNEMTWVQYRDADHKLGERFGINSIPHYFTIDSDGVLTAEMLGSGSDVEGKLKKLLKRARQSRPAAQEARVGSAGN